MRDVIITARTDGYEIDKSGDILGISSENLQGKIIFKPEPFIDGACRMYIDEKGSILLKKEDECYTLPILSSLLNIGDFSYCFKITQSETEEGIPIFATRITDMQVLDSITDETEIPEQYPTWIETFDSKIAEIEKLEQTVTENEKARDEKVNTAVQNIKDLTADYNENAQKKTDEFNENAGKKLKEYDDKAEEKEAELNTIVATARDFVSAVTFTEIEQNFETGELEANNAESLGNMNFGFNYETGNLEVGINE